MFFYGLNVWYWALILVTTLVGVSTQAYIKKTYKKWLGVPLQANKTGAEVAKEMLAANGVDGVSILSTGGGELDDFYDPRDNTLHLSQANLHDSSVSSAAVACHEAGHACQHAAHYAPEAIRAAIVPVVNFASSAWIFVLLIGIFMEATQLVWLAIILFSCVLAFQLITLPVEFNASGRAIRYLQTAGYDEQTLTGSKAVLRAAALTYVAAAFASALQLLWLLGQTKRR